jgi:hypothetical protein
VNNDNFLSIDRLVEFGLGIGIAQQMVKSMNHMMDNTQMPKIQGVSIPNMRQYYVAIDGKSAGPFSEAELSRLIAEGGVKKDTLLWRLGMPKWDVPENIPDVLRLIALAPPPIPTKESEA